MAEYLVWSGWAVQGGAQALYHGFKAVRELFSRFGRKSVTIWADCQPGDVFQRGFEPFGGGLGIIVCARHSSLRYEGRLAPALSASRFARFWKHKRFRSSAICSKGQVARQTPERQA
jgi:hypothetical protein